MFGLRDSRDLAADGGYSRAANQFRTRARTDHNALMGAAQSFEEQPEGYELYNCTLLRRMWSAGVNPVLDDAGNSHPCSTPSHPLFILVVIMGVSVGCTTCMSCCQLCNVLKNGGDDEGGSVGSRING